MFALRKDANCHPPLDGPQAEIEYYCRLILTLSFMDQFSHALIKPETMFPELLGSLERFRRWLFQITMD